jgi:hypothetical protein
MFKLSSILLLLLIANPAGAEVLTLHEVEQRALASDATRGAIAKIAQTDADLEVARSKRRPVFSLNTEASVAPAASSSRSGPWMVSASWFRDRIPSVSQARSPPALVTGG